MHVAPDAVEIVPASASARIIVERMSYKQLLEL
jgi:hypothetical protein